MKIIFFLNLDINEHYLVDIGFWLNFGMKTLTLFYFLMPVSNIILNRVEIKKIPVRVIENVETAHL